MVAVSESNSKLAGASLPIHFARSEVPGDGSDFIAWTVSRSMYYMHFVNLAGTHETGIWRLKEVHASYTSLQSYYRPAINKNDHRFPFPPSRGDGRSFVPRFVKTERPARVLSVPKDL